MPWFRKRLVIIEAVQWNVDGKLLGRECKDHPAVRARMGIVEGLEGRHVVCPNDWIITGVQGEHYACKPDIFVATYEAVDESECGGSRFREVVQ